MKFLINGSSEKQEGLLKRLKNIEGKTDNQLQTIEDQKNNQSGLKSVGYSIRDRYPEKAVKSFDDLVTKDKTINCKKLSKDIVDNEHDFTKFWSMGELLNIYIMGTF